MDNRCPFCDKEVRSLERHIMANHLGYVGHGYHCWCGQWIGVATQLVKKHWAKHGGVIAHWLAHHLKG